MFFFTVGDTWLFAVFTNQLIESLVGTKLIVVKLISDDVKPTEHRLVLFFVMIDLLFQFVQVAIEPEKQLFGVQKIDGLVHMRVS